MVMETLQCVSRLCQTVTVSRCHCCSAKRHRVGNAPISTRRAAIIIVVIFDQVTMILFGEVVDFTKVFVRGFQP